MTKGQGFVVMGILCLTLFFLREGKHRDTADGVFLLFGFIWFIQGVVGLFLEWLK